MLYKILRLFLASLELFRKLAQFFCHLRVCQYAKEVFMMSKAKFVPLSTIDGKTLMNCPLKPPNFIIGGLLSQGLHILAGSPKVDKSWLALWLAVTVAKGEEVWSMTVKQGTTLYLCLEDSQLRIQNRLFEITEDAPSSVHFCTDSAVLGQGLEEQLETFLSEHPDTVLVIIDRPKERSDNTAGHQPKQGARGASSTTQEHAKKEMAARLWLSYYNRVLYEKGLITEREHNRMEIRINDWKMTMS